MKHIVFLCAGNTCRSPMAEGIFRAIVSQKGGDYTVSSAGLYAMEGDPVAANAVAACQEIGVDIAGHTAKAFTASLMEGDTVAVPLTHAYADALLGAGAPRDKLYIPVQSIFDPYGGDLNCYRQCRDQLQGLCARFYEELKQHG